MQRPICAKAPPNTGETRSSFSRPNGSRRARRGAARRDRGSRWASRRWPETRPAYRSCRPARRTTDRAPRDSGHSGPAANNDRQSLRDRLRSPSCRRIVAAHDALQIRKLADHIGDEIRLGQACGGRADPSAPCNPAEFHAPAPASARPCPRACRAWRGTPCRPAPAPGSQRPCGPDPRRTWRPTDARAARVSFPATMALPPSPRPYWRRSRSAAPESQSAFNSEKYF